jgi:RNA methyltransferase, TrmH family
MAGVARVITSPANERLKRIRHLESGRWRRKLGLFAVEGEDLVEAGLSAGLEPVDVLVAGEDVQADLLAGVSTLPHPPRVIAVFRTDELPRLEPSRSLQLGIALWHVADPGNVGTLMRAADAFGPAFVALSEGCADPLGQKALRASAGAIFRVPTCRFDAAPGRRVALVSRGGTPLPELELEQATTFVLGAERGGLPPDVLARCDERATIPQTGAAESLNVAMAGAIALYERVRRG